MKICCLGDIHYHGNLQDLDLLIDRVENSCTDVDVVAVVGDLTSSGRLDYTKEVLEAVRRAAGTVPVLIVPGNHDIYLTREEMDNGINSLLKLSVFNELAERTGCVALMKRPFILGDTAFVGSIGWYDYSFAPEWLNLPLEAYREKAYGMSTWADREFVKLPLSDEEFTLALLDRLEKHVKQVYDAVDKIVVVLHHVPFRELVRYKLVPEWDYFSTFMGSDAFGNLIERYSSKVKLALYGHSHDGVDTGFCREMRGVRTCSCASPAPLLISI